ncbi:cytochrome P450 [Nonomuraea antri]|uniref:cytochrome P450 n=1 Tax=Nonomuraea antri TaxID=2730852 RepID=UPI0038B278B5
MDAEALYRDPYPVYAQARDAPGLTFVPELAAWLVSRHADVRDVLSRPADFSSRGALRPDLIPGPAAIAALAEAPGNGAAVVLGADGETHQRLRKPLTRGLSPARVSAALPFVAATARELLDAFTPAGRVEWMSAYARPLPAAVIGHLLGLDPAEVPGAIAAGNRAEDLAFTPMTEQEQVAAAREVAALRRRLDELAAGSRAQETLTGELARALAPGPGAPTPGQRDEVVANTQNVMLAGHLTTTALLGSVVHHLLRERGQWELLCARPELIPAAIEEANRFEAPVQGFRRLVTRPLTLSGTELAAGDTVFVSFASAGRDAAVHERPDVFDITREPVRNLSFGHGGHGCPGSNLAREQVRITLELLVSELPGLRLADQDVVMAATLIHRAPESLLLTW